MAKKQAVQIYIQNNQGPAIIPALILTVALLSTYIMAILYVGCYN